jgi:hypothetical protein
MKNLENNPENKPPENKPPENNGTIKQQKPKKRSPGRPRKINPKPKPIKKGIVSVPYNEDQHIEFEYDNPMIFKKIWDFFKIMAVNRIKINFLHDKMILSCQDHLKKSDIYVEIDCSKVNHYYCKEELEINLLNKNLELIMKTIDKTCNSVTFLSNINNNQKYLNIIFKNDVGIDEIHNIELIGNYDFILNKNKFEDQDYTIKFKLSGQYFKKMITNIKSFSGEATIKKDGIDEPLMITYTKNDKKIKSINILNKNIIPIESKLGEDDTFRTSFNVEYIKPISSSLLSEYIHIYADENKPLMFHANLNEGIIKMKILTCIIDIRNTF